jgi:hypothetical protein
MTAAHMHDKHALPDLLHGGELLVYGDSAYASRQKLIAGKAPATEDCTSQWMRTVRGRADQAECRRNCKKSKVRARVNMCGQSSSGCEDSARCVRYWAAKECDLGVHRVCHGRSLPAPRTATSIGTERVRPRWRTEVCPRRALRQNTQSEGAAKRQPFDE